jgi:ferrous iron transport protein A
VRLSDLGKGDCGHIRGLTPEGHDGPDEIGHAELERRLLEMGFVEGARFQILHEGLVGRDPIALKLDDMRVALRRREAGAILVERDS